MSPDLAALLGATRFRPAAPVAGADFPALHAAARAAPLAEVVPAGPADRAAALGFALAWAATAGLDGPIVWAVPDGALAAGLPHAEGLAQFGLPPGRLLLVRAPDQAQALWAAELALATPGAMVLCVAGPGRRGLSLTATRRLLLAAERGGTRGLLLRLDGPEADRLGASAAWTRWLVAAAASPAAGQELGPPAFAVRLARNRAGPADLSWQLSWEAPEHAFRAIAPRHDAARHRPLGGGMAAAPADRPAAQAWRRAG